MIYSGLVLTGFGCFAGMIFALFEGVAKLTKDNFIVVFISDIVATLLAGLLFILAIFITEYGSFAFFEVLCFAFGLVFVLFVKNSFASLILMLYNKFKLRRRANNDSGETN